MKARIRTFVDNILFTPKPLPASTYQGVYQLSDGSNCRLHLRVDNAGEGLLILNASTILHLNSSATEFAYHLIQQSSEDVFVKEITKRYHIAPDQVLSDYQTFVSRLESLLLTPDLDPETFLDIDRVDLHENRSTAPLRLDCALTYQVSEGSNSSYAPTDRVKRSLDTQEWETILQKAWDRGIPHVVFTGGEPSLRPDLPEIIAFSEQLGQVTGLLTDGSRLNEKNYLHSLLNAGLDHIMLILDPSESASWEAVKDVINEDISLTVHLTINKNDLSSSVQVLEKLKKLGVLRVSISASSQENSIILPDLSRKIHEMGLSLVWDLPVPYSEVNPIALELLNVDNVLKGAARSWLYVEPDGDVLPGQGINHVLGNMLTDPWESIWSEAKIWKNEPK